MENSFSIPISRRDFMKLATLSAASALPGGTLSSGKAEGCVFPCMRTFAYASLSFPI
ncbi:MAG: twin-arginine translocation signal domain-containing protein [Selenomonadaceae bacterium]|nr:twin-arginine translocation signal domain-containing protein [Selenomonadaceae bacterium]